MAANVKLWCLRSLLILVAVVETASQDCSRYQLSRTVEFMNCDKKNPGQPVNKFGLDEKFRIEAKPKAFDECLEMRTESTKFQFLDPKRGQNAAVVHEVVSKLNYIEIKPGTFTSYGVLNVFYDLTASRLTGPEFKASDMCGIELVFRNPVIEFTGGSDKQEMSCEKPIKLKFTVSMSVSKRDRSSWSTYVTLESTGGTQTADVVESPASLSRGLPNGIKPTYVTRESTGGTRTAGVVESDLIIFPDFVPTCNPKTAYKFVIVIPDRDSKGQDKGKKEFSAIRILSTSGFISIQCVFNCKELINPNQMVTFKVVATKIQIAVNSVKWSIKEVESVDWSKWRRKTKNDELSLIENVLKFNTSYTVTVQSNWEKVGDLEATRSFKTSKQLIAGNCSVNPKEGLLGTDFLITCVNYLGTPPLLYELFIKKSETELSYIEGSYINSFSVVMPENSATIRINDANGNFHEETITIKLIEEDDLHLTIERLKKRIESTSYHKEWKTSVELMSSLSVVLTEKNLMTVGNKLEILRGFGRINEYSDIMIRSSASVVQSVNLNNQYDPDEILMCSGIVLAKLSQHLLYLTKETRLNFKSNNLTWTSTYLLSAVERTVRHKRLDSRVLNLNAHDYEVHLNKMRKGTSELVTGTYNIMKSVVYDSWGVAIERSETYENVRMDIRLSTPETAFQFNTEEVKLEFSQNFGDQYREFEKISISQTSVPNLFWWLPEEVNTDNVIANVVGFKAGREVIVTQSKQPFVVNLGVTSSRPRQFVEPQAIGRNVTSVEAGKISTDYLTGRASYAPVYARGNARDNYLSVHRLVYSKGKGQLLMLTNDNVRILAQQGKFPSYEDALRRKSTAKFVSLNLKEPTDLLSVRVYVAVLPAQSGVGPVPYNISIRHVVCQIWSDYTFNDRYCQVGRNISWDSIHCDCVHFSVFVGNFFTPPNSLHLWNDLGLFATIHDNYYILVLAGGLFSIMLILLLLTCLFDYRSDQFVAHLLEDNYPKDTIPYLVCVQSGRECSYNNTAKVAIQIYGSTYNSKVHILNSNTKKVLRPGSEDWFLIFCPKPLGVIESVEIWHDDSGKHPNWYCVRVTVVDLNSEKTYIFRFDNWLSLEVMQGSATRPATKIRRTDHDDDPSTLLQHHLRMGFREEHRWSRIVTRHPRSKFTKSERVTMVFGVTMTSMLVSMMFYGLEYNGPSDFPLVDFSIKNWLIGFQSSLISAALLFGVFFCFSRSKKGDSEEETAKTIVISQGNPNPDLEWHPTRLRSIIMVSKLYNRGIKATMMSMMPTGIHPVIISKTVKSRKWGWLVAAWTFSMIVNVATTFFVIWYGLKFGKKKSLDWMISFFLGIFSDICVMQTLKVIAVAVLLAYIFRGKSPDSVRVEAVKNVPEPDTWNERIEFLRKYCSLRTSPAYKPLYPDYVKITSAKRQKRAQLKKNIIRFTLAFSFVLPIIIYLNSLYLKIEYLTTSSFTETIAEKVVPGLRDFSHIQNKTELLEFVVWSLLPVLHTLKWYNGKSFALEMTETEEDVRSNHSENLVRGYMPEGSTKVLGVARIYQQRIKPEWDRPIPEQFQQWFHSAYGGMHRFNEDTQSYGKFWIKHPESDSNLNVWDYQDAIKSDTSVVFSETVAAYTGGGYLVNLQSTKGGTTGILTDLYMNNWMDNLTRLIVLEINLYTLNTNRYRLMKLIFETLPSGQMSKRINIETLFLITREQTVKQFSCLAVIIILTTILIPMCYMQYSPVGLPRYLKSLSNINEIIIAMTSLVFLITFLHKYFTFLNYEAIQTNSRDEYISIRHLITSQLATGISYGFFSLFVFIGIGYGFFKIVNVHRIIRNFIQVCALALLPGFIALAYSFYTSFAAALLEHFPLRQVHLPHLHIYGINREDQSILIFSLSIATLAMFLLSKGILVYECQETERLHALKFRPVLKVQRIMVESSRENGNFEPMIPAKRNLLKRK